MVATLGVSLVQVTAPVTSCVVPSVRVPVAWNWSEAPRASVGFKGAMAILARMGGVTVRVAVAETVVVFVIVAVMVVVPGLRPVARPPGEVIVATVSLLLVQVAVPVSSWVVASV
jgi:hypothetical protein